MSATIQQNHATLTFKHVVQIIQSILDSLSSLRLELLARLVKNCAKDLVNGWSHGRHQIFVPVQVETSFLEYMCSYSKVSSSLRLVNDRGPCLLHAAL